MELFEELEEKIRTLFLSSKLVEERRHGLDFEIIPLDSDDDRDKEIAEFVESQLGSLRILRIL